MKRFLLITIHSILLLNLKSQVVFCAPGAMWNYRFSGTIWSGGASFAETVSYVQDSVENGESLKLLRHNRFEENCGPYVSYTLLKQKGDTIFIKNPRTQNNWEILYNFATPIGQSWQSTIGAGTVKIYTVTVNATSTIIVNGFALKQMSVTISPGPGFGATGVNKVVTERFGSNGFLFMYTSRSWGSCDGDVFLDYLCYIDSAFGTKQFTELPCFYYNPTEVDKNSFLKSHIEVFPNPCSNLLSIKGLSSGTHALAILTDFTGRDLKKIFVSEKAELNMSDLPRGIYLLQIKRSGNLLMQRKIIKE